MEINLDHPDTRGAITRLRLAGATIDWGTCAYRMPFTNVWIKIAEYIQQEHNAENDALGNSEIGQ